MRCLRIAAAGWMVVASATGQVVVDDFNGSTLSPAKWETLLPFSDSSLSVSGGVLTMANRARITPVHPYTTSEVVGRFRFVGGSLDGLRIALRTTGNAELVGTPDDGLLVGFWAFQDPHNNYHEVAVVDMSNGRVRLGTAPYPIPMGTFVDFKVTDDGSNISVFVNDLENPLITVSSDTDAGDTVAIMNRSNLGGSNIVEFDHLRISPYGETHGPMPHNPSRPHTEREGTHPHGPRRTGPESGPDGRRHVDHPPGAMDGSPNDNPETYETSAAPATPLPVTINLATAIEIFFDTEDPTTRYQLQSAEPSAPDVWTDVGEAVYGNGGERQIFESIRQSPGRLYRVISESSASAR